MQIILVKLTLYRHRKMSNKMAVSAVTEHSQNMKQTISHELPSGFFQNMYHTDLFVEFLM